VRQTSAAFAGDGVLENGAEAPHSTTKRATRRVGLPMLPGVTEVKGLECGSHQQLWVCWGIKSGAGAPHSKKLARFVS
jgi:hypothetical protein